MAPSTPHVVGCCPTLSRIGYWPLAQVGRVFHGHCSTPVSKSPRQLGCTRHACVHTPCPARSRCSSCRRRRPRQHCTITRGTRQILHGSHGTPAAVPCACVGSAARARARSIARRLRQHAARGRAHQRPAAGRVCMHVAGSQGRGLRAGCSLSIATRLLGGAVDDHARSIDRLEGLEVADERKHLCRAPLLELKRGAYLAIFPRNFCGSKHYIFLSSW